MRGSQQEVGREMVGVGRWEEGDRDSELRIPLWKGYAKDAYLFFGLRRPTRRFLIDWP